MCHLPSHAPDDNRGSVGKADRRERPLGGLWRKPDGIMRMTGVYLAMWIPSAASWRLKSDAFVALSCMGSSSCEKSN
jgi:hypothetical protein